MMVDSKLAVTTREKALGAILHRNITQSLHPQKRQSEYTKLLGTEIDNESKIFIMFMFITLVVS